jgi:hypothetical protein
MNQMHILRGNEDREAATTLYGSKLCDLNRLAEHYTRQRLLKFLLKITTLFAGTPGNEAIRAYQ